MGRVPSRRLTLVSLPTVLVLLLATFVATLGGGQAAEERPSIDKRLLHLSSSVALRAWLANPSTAPEYIRPQLEALADARDAGAARAAVAAADDSVTRADRFNRDFLGLPQNEESLDVCTSRPNVTLGGTNDYRGLLNPRGNFTGWHFSRNGGRTLLNEGLLPAVSVRGVQRPSGGDPVTVAGKGCALYAASLNYDPADPFGNSNGIGIYRTKPWRLARCPGGDAPSCWPNRRAAATSRPNHFLDKPWMTVGRSGGRQVVWVVYSDFDFTAQNEAGFTAQLFAVRCSANLAHCTAPILISGGDEDIQFGDVTVGRDGRTYITWSQILGELEGTPQTFIHKMRVAPAGSTRFGPTRIVHRETRAVPFGGKLNGNEFRIATYPKNAVATVHGRPRVFVTWEACSVRVLSETICEDAVVKLKWSDNQGRSWKGPVVLSVRGQNYFPTIDADPHRHRVLVGYFTSRYDPRFDNRQDVEMVTLDSRRPGRVLNRQRLTRPSNEPEADPLLGGIFIGDYIEVVALNGRAYLHYNANYVHVRLLHEGRPIPQQDNFLARTRQ